jgi:hypothetical protein
MCDSVSDMPGGGGCGGCSGGYGYYDSGDLGTTNSWDNYNGPTYTHNSSSNGGNTPKTKAPLKELRDIVGLMQDIVTKANVPVEVTKKVLTPTPIHMDVDQMRMEEDYREVTEALNAFQNIRSIECINEHMPDVQTTRDCLDSVYEERLEVSEDLRIYD